MRSAFIYTRRKRHEQYYIIRKVNERPGSWDVSERGKEGKYAKYTLAVKRFGQRDETDFLIV